MSYTETVLLALALAVDAFSVGVSVGLKHCAPRQIFRLSFHFGLFQALLAGIGAVGGIFLLEWFANWDHWIVMIILTALGARMIHGGIKGGGEETVECRDMTKGWTMIGLSTAVSIDALAAGVSLPTGQMPVGWSTALIGIVSAVGTLLAMLLAGRVGTAIGKRAEIVAGVVLIGIGIKTVFEHLA